MLVQQPQTRRCFEFCSRTKDEPEKLWRLPERKTTSSAGYDFTCPEDVEIPGGGIAKIKTGIKVQLPPNEFLSLHIRSSLASKCHLNLVNAVGIIDADYYNNPDNEGEIIAVIENRGEAPVQITRGMCFVQGIIQGYKVVSNDHAQAKRVGGFGSTSEDVWEAYKDAIDYSESVRRAMR